MIDDNILAPSLKDKFDFITCISVLEHIPQHDEAIDSMFALLSPGGYVALTFPYNEREYVENVYALPGAGYGRDLPYVCQVYSRSQVDRWLARNHGKLVAQEYGRMFTGEYWTFGERLRPPVQGRSGREASPDMLAPSEARWESKSVRIVVVAGARPNFHRRSPPLMWESEPPCSASRRTLVHTGQHYQQTNG